MLFKKKLYDYFKLKPDFVKKFIIVFVYVKNNKIITLFDT